MKTRTLLFAGVLLLAGARTVSAQSQTSCNVPRSYLSAHQALLCESRVLTRLNEEIEALYERRQSLQRDARQQRAYRDAFAHWRDGERAACRDLGCLGPVLWQQAAAMRADLEALGNAPRDITRAAESQAALEQLLAQEAAAREASRPFDQQSDAQRAAHVTLPAKPRNPGYLPFCATAQTRGQFALCDSQTYVPFLRELSRVANRPYPTEGLPASVVRAASEETLDPLKLLVVYPEKTCRDMSVDCLSQAVLSLEQRALALLEQSRQERKTQRERYEAAARSAPVQVDNGDHGARDARRYGGNFTALWVTNRTAKALRTIDVECHLYEDRADAQPVEAQSMRHTIVGNIAPQSDHFAAARVPVPWDMARWGTDAQFVKCDVLAMTEADADQARQALVEQRAERERRASLTQAAMAQWDREREAARAESEMDQVKRLATALQAASAGSTTCRSLASTYAPQLRTVQQAQAIHGNAAVLAMVNGMISYLRNAKCVR